MNDMFQILTSAIIPAVCGLIAIDAIICIWYHRPYENIFEDVLPINFCQAVLVMISALSIVQMFGMKAGNCESSISINIYIVMQTIFVVLMMT